MFFGMVNKVHEATEVFNKDITVADGCKRCICVNTSDPLVDTTFHLGDKIRSILNTQLTPAYHG
jgi:hypothetical protein